MSNLTKNRLIRFYEIVPAGLVWGALIGAIALSAMRPLTAIYVIILFDLYWLFRVGYFVFYLSAAWGKYSQETHANWRQLVDQLPEHKDILHCIFLPTYKEGREVLVATLESLKHADYDTQRFVVVLAGEERDREQFESHAQYIVRAYEGVFRDIVVTIHPAGAPDEIPGKGSNLHFAGKKMQAYFEERGIPFEHIIVSAFDSDTCAHPQYWARLAHAYITNPCPTRASYQPVALYNNNIWDAPGIIRIASFGTTFWLMSELLRPERLQTFSSHSMSFQMLVDVGFWEKDVVSEDSRIYLQAFLHYKGDYRIIPLFVPVSMDTVAGETLIESLKNLYKQQRRWAYGAEHFPYLMTRFARIPEIRVGVKIKYIWNLVEGMFTWATAPLLIFLLGWLPFQFGKWQDITSVLFYNAPHVLEVIMRCAMVGIVLSVVLSIVLLPPIPSHVGRHHIVLGLLQWLFLPVSLIVFGSLPAIDAQTRLMVGKYMGFNVTEKKRYAAR